MSEQFITKYISDSISSGTNNPDDICAKAEMELSQVENELMALDILKNKRNNLLDVVRQLKGKSVNKTDNVPLIDDFSIPMESLSPQIKSVCSNICSYVENSKLEKITPRDIMDSVGSIKDNHIIYTAIKWLLEHDILSRKEVNMRRTIIKGNKWEERF